MSINNHLVEYFNLHHNRLTLKQYIEFCLYSQHGFYNNGQPFGREGAFVTAPIISSIFGDIIALFLINIIQSSVEDEDQINIVEIGGGNGNLLSDLIRMFQKFGQIFDRTTFYSLEKSPLNIDLQRSKMPDSVVYINSTKQINPKKPTFVISNELLDAYPVNQYINKCSLWYQSYVKLEDGKVIMHHEENFDKSELEEYIGILGNPELSNTVIEASKECIEDFRDICRIVAKNSGGLLYFDYGYFELPGVSTLQALKKHQKIGIFDAPMESDITHLVNFNLFDKISGEIIKSPFISELTTQGDFLRGIGLLELQELYLKNTPSDLDAENLRLATQRLISKDQMGELFKVLLKIVL